MKKKTKNKAWRRLSAVMNRVGRRHEQIPEEKIERDIDEAIQAVRKDHAIELFNRLNETLSSKPITKKDLERTRAKVWKEKFEPRAHAIKASRKPH